MLRAPTALQYDALTEVVNIAFGRTAASLSQLTHQRVLLDVPDVKVYPLSELSAGLRERLPETVVSVHQIFLGQLTGDAMIVFDEAAARLLVGMLLEEDGPVPCIDLSARDILTEVGNILLGACLSVFGNLLHVPVTFSVPCLERSSLEEMLRSIRMHQKELQGALVISTGFRTRESNVHGYLVIVLGVTSLERLMEAADDLR